MDIRVQGANPGLVNADRLSHSQSSQNSKGLTDNAPDFLQTLKEKEMQIEQTTSSKAVLSMSEKATLHVLFGSEKPDDSSFYGKNNSAQIYKGHLLDVAG